MASLNDVQRLISSGVYNTRKQFFAGYTIAKKMEGNLFEIQFFFKLLKIYYTVCNIL